MKYKMPVACMHYQASYDFTLSES